MQLWFVWEKYLFCLKFQKLLSQGIKSWVNAYFIFLFTFDPLKMLFHCLPGGKYFKNIHIYTYLYNFLFNWLLLTFSFYLCFLLNWLWYALLWLNWLQYVILFTFILLQFLSLLDLWFIIFLYFEKSGGIILSVFFFLTPLESIANLLDILIFFCMLAMLHSTLFFLSLFHE